MNQLNAAKVNHWTRRVGVVVVVVTVLLSLPGGFITTGVAAGDTTVELSPATQSIDAGTTTNVSVELTEVDGGVGSYEFTLTTSTTETLTITDVELAGSPGQSTVNYADDGSSVDVRATLAETADTGAVSIATVTVQGETAGSTDLTLSEVSAGDEGGNSYTITETGAAAIDVQESTTIQNTNLSPTTVDEGSTVTQSVSFTALKMSNDGNTDSFTISAPTDVQFSAPDVNVTDADGQAVALESGPSLSDTNGGTDNQITFAIAPDGSFDTTEIDVAITTTASYPDVASNQTREVVIDIADSSNETATDTAAVEVQNTDTGGDDTSNQTVTLSPSDQTVRVNDSTTVDLEVEPVTNGVGSYEFVLTLNNSSQASITDVSLGGDPGQDDVNIASDGGNVTVTAALADTADTGTVSIATVTVVGTAPGTVTLSPTINDLGDEVGNPYVIASTGNATIEIEGGPGDVTGDGSPARDLDGDGVYEDVNGDGQFAASDVQALFAALDNVEGQTAFDFNGNGQVAASDVQALFAQLG